MVIFFTKVALFFYTTTIANNDSIVVFIDKQLRLLEETSYMTHIQNKRDGFILESYITKQNQFGTIAMLTNIADKEPEFIYLQYKTRMEVEGVFDVYKNLLEADKTYMQSDVSLNGWLFINHIAIMLYYSIFGIIKEHGMSPKLSPADLIVRLSRVSKVKIGLNWHLAEINSKTIQILRKLGKPIT